MNVWVFLGSLFILVCVFTVAAAIYNLVSIVNDTRDRTETLARIAVKYEKKVCDLDDDLSNLAEKIKLNSAKIQYLGSHYEDLLKRIDEIAALDGACAQLLMRVDDLEKKLEKGGAQIERKTGRTGKEG